MVATDAAPVPEYGTVRPAPAPGADTNKRQLTGSNKYAPLPASVRSLDHCAVLNKGTDEELTARGYRRSLPRLALWYLTSALLALTPLLLAHWRPDWRLKLTHRRCALQDATAVLLKDAHGRVTVEPVVTESAGPATPDRFRIVEESEDSESGSEPADSSPLLALRQPDQGHLRYFWAYHLKYTWDHLGGRFVQLSGLDRDCSVHALLEEYRGFSETQRDARLSLYGQNQITVEVKSYLKLLVEEALNPFYIFQVGSLTLWSMDNYLIYAACIFVISVISIGVSLYETRKQSETLRDMVLASAVGSVTVRRDDGETVEVCSERLVPGDVLVLPENGCSMACDAVLITGSCIVNESMLTGESVPVTKTQLTQHEDGELYSPESHRRHTLFCGTKVIQTRYYGRSPVLAVVIRTGFSTAKGELIRSILFPKPMGFKFYKDSMKFMGFMFMLSLCGMCYTVYMYISRGNTPQTTVLRALDIITIVVPPALPAAMTVGTVYAQNRLKVANIFCISPPRINVCGKLKLFCFDKTGTLTEDGLSMWGVVPCTPSGFSEPERDVSALSDASELKVALASCHGLTRLAGQLIGDPLDIKMFEATDWELEEPVETDATKFDLLMPTVVRPRRAVADAGAPELAPELTPDAEPLAPELTPEVGIVRQFPFSSSSQRMSVICRTLGRRHMDLYCKGAPEKVEGLCRPDSVPDDFATVLHQYTVKGYRVLALAYRRLDTKLHWHQAQRLKRDQVECEMELTGLLVMQNSLKPQTTPVIETLQRANVRSVMVTGDNLLTAVSVARECGMIPPDAAAVVVTAHPPTSERPAYLEYETAAADVAPMHRSDDQVSVPLWTGAASYRLAVTGRSWRVLQQHFPSLMPRIVVQGTVFARMAPEQKAQLVETLQDQGYTVGMCGDGANDCEALKAAHVGISLSEAEASVAAPFTSKVADITCVPTVMREGRAALTTSFGTFQYMALYSLVQFVSVLLLYRHFSNLGDVQFLYIDLVITTSVAVLMGYTAASPRLHRRRPAGSLLGASTLCSILTQMALAAGAQMAAIWFLEQQPWYEPVPPAARGPDVTVVCWVNTVVFFVSSYQYLILATAFSKGPPFRRPFYTNRLFLGALLLLGGLQTTLVLWPEEHLVRWFGLAPPRHDDKRLRYSLLAVTACHCLLSLGLEKFMFGAEWFKRVSRPCRCKKGPKNRYKHVLRDVEDDPAWPPLGQKVMATDEPS